MLLDDCCQWSHVVFTCIASCGWRDRDPSACASNGASNSARGAAPEAQFERTAAHRKPSRAGESLPPQMRSTLPCGAVFSPDRHPWSRTLATGSVNSRAAANSARGAAPQKPNSNGRQSSQHACSTCSTCSTVSTCSTCSTSSTCCLWQLHVLQLVPRNEHVPSLGTHVPLKCADACARNSCNTLWDGGLPALFVRRYNHQDNKPAHSRHSVLGGISVEGIKSGHSGHTVTNGYTLHCLIDHLVCTYAYAPMHVAAPFCVYVHDCIDSIGIVPLRSEM
jgi:hypothetical protein